MKNELKILCILPVLGQPRFSKRIQMLIDGGFKVNAVAFEREYHNGRQPNCNVKILGNISHGNYIRRIKIYISVVCLLHREFKKYDIIYSFGSDVGYLSIIAGLFFRKPRIFEVGDIRNIQVLNSIGGRIIRLFDRYFIAKYSLVVSTSKYFISEYYSKRLGLKLNTIIIENKLESKCKTKYFPKTTNKIRIGYFGLLRCERSLEVLKDIADRYSKKFEILIAGYSITQDINLNDIKMLDNVKYFGEFKSPRDLPELYGSVDIVWACYPFPQNNELNWKWARTNRYYESLCYKKPMIVLEGSGDAKLVAKYNLGISIRLDNITIASDMINSIEQHDLTLWEKNLESISQNEFVYSNEKDLLRNSIISIWELVSN